MICLKRLSFLSVFYLLCLSATAQNPANPFAFRGTIRDASLKPLEGVTVTKKGTNNTVQSKADGSFNITSKDSALTLVFSFVGKIPQELALTSPRADISVIMADSSVSMEDVVVIAYGKTSKKLVSNSVVTLTAKDVEDLPVASPAEAMVGQVAGANISTPSGEPGQNPYIRIRGLGSIGAGNNPLFVVDGYPLNNNDNFYNINSADIQSIQILKDAAACAIYGSRGGNGIVLVTTKRGAIGKTKFSANVYGGISNVSKTIKLLDKDQYMDYTLEAYKNSGLTPPAGITDPSALANTDWQDEIFRTGYQSNYQISASGGTENAKFYITGNYFKQTGVVDNTGFDRILLRANYEAKLSKKLRFSLTLAPNFSRTDTKPIQGNFNNSTISNGGQANIGAVVTTALLMPPIIPVFTDNGNYGQPLTLFGNAVNVGGLYNPIATLDLYRDKSNSFKGMMISNLEYEIIRNLTFKTTLGGEMLSDRRNFYVPATLANGSAPTANLNNPILAGINAQQRNSTTYNWVWENTLNYSRTLFGEHRIDALAGYGAQRNTTENSSVSGQASSYTNTDVEYVTGAGNILGTAGYSANALVSVFGRLNYSFKDRYIVSASVRSDGSSRFGSDNRYATFPSVSVAWRVADEKFMKKFEQISELKLRASYGITGNNNIGDYNWQAYGAAANYIFGPNAGNRVYGFVPNSVAIKNLTWETNKQTDLALELGLLRNRIYLVVEAYERNTTNLLLNRNVPALVGFANRVLNNVGKVRNRGLDIQLQTTNINQKDFKWTTNANIFWMNNKVIALTSASDQILFDPVFGYTSAIRVVPGMPMGTFFGYKQVGVYMNENDVANSAVWAAGGSRPGDIKYEDVNDDKKIDAADIQPLGNPFPKFSYGLQNSFTYKKFTFSFSIQGSYGGKILNGTDRYVYNFYGRVNARENALNRWRSEDEPGDGMTPRVLNGAQSWLNAFSTYQLFDASFLRIRNVQVRYTLPSPFVKKMGLSYASVYVMAQNLHTFSSYFGYNPEANLYGNSTNPTYGVDQGAYPLNRTITLGANISF
ncbi:TonB-dependent receptor [Terrimonas sp. NA20]|uniref:TonB-dependent receptor n=1 Tax=Terrimonas ginsenosidimutans TaxID=2908004 RepID=A0ABS9KSP1_9BACT|nr:TonB-dependent receptor [Terrimonas ginsenosidimutans]MCG2615313.1 TonB-dependent receptor [Terrimonas ginsenosidimutans]